MIAAPVLAGAPTDRIKRITDRLIAIVSDPALMPPEKKTEREKMLRKAVDEMFDWEAFSQRALAKHWRKRTAEEKKEFIVLFGKLIERTYMDKTRQYSGEKAIFLKETIDGKYGVVEAKVVTKGNREVAVSYRVIHNGINWFVYDIQIEGISLVSNYRSQFNSIIMKSSYQELVKRLREKVEQE